MLTKKVDGITVILTPEEEQRFLAEQAKVKAELDAVKYKEDRMEAYPSIGDQLDLIFHQGIDAWKAQIQAIKDKYPKPETK